MPRLICPTPLVLFSCAACVCLLAACAPAQRPVASPVAASPAAAPGAKRAPHSPLPDAPAAVPPAPNECTTLVQHPVEAPPSCDLATAQNALDAALEGGGKDASERDARLARVEGCAALPVGLVRALRIELAPPACGDVLAAAFFAGHPASVRSDIEQTIVGLGLAARLSRLVRDPPRLEPPFDKPKFLDFFEHALKPWIVVQARTINETAIAGARLSGYGRAVAAVEAGLADMRFVEVTRAVPLPDEMSRDAEVRDQYYVMLDQALEPRKQRGRDAALAGLKGLEQEGILSSPRLGEARRLLSVLYGGRRIDALDRLAVVSLPSFEPNSSVERLATKLPTFYAGIILATSDPNDPRLFRALIAQGIPSGVRANLGSSAQTGAMKALWARGLFELGRTYWNAADFRFAARAAQEVADSSGPSVDTDSARLVAALGGILASGPADAAQMMLRGPFIPSDVGKTSALDRIAASSSSVAAPAAFDSAYLRNLVPPVEPNPEFWKRLAEDYRRAAKRLKDPATARDAADRAKAAEDTAKTLESSAK